MFQAGGNNMSNVTRLDDPITPMALAYDIIETGKLPYWYKFSRGQIFAGINFRGDLFSRIATCRIWRVLIFANHQISKIWRGFIFANLKFSQKNIYLSPHYYCHRFRDSSHRLSVSDMIPSYPYTVKDKWMGHNFVNPY